MYRTILFFIAWLVLKKGVICHEAHPFLIKGLKKLLSNNLRLYIIQHHDWADDESHAGTKDDYKKKKLTPVSKSCTFVQLLLQLVSYANEG